LKTLVSFDFDSENFDTGIAIFLRASYKFLVVVKNKDRRWDFILECFQLLQDHCYSVKVEIHFTYFLQSECHYSFASLISWKKLSIQRSPGDLGRTRGCCQFVAKQVNPSSPTS
jgi:hypothetical protein